MPRLDPVSVEITDCRTHDPGRGVVLAGEVVDCIFLASGADHRLDLVAKAVDTGGGALQKGNPQNDHDQRNGAQDHDDPANRAAVVDHVQDRLVRLGLDFPGQGLEQEDRDHRPAAPFHDGSRCFSGVFRPDLEPVTAGRGQHAGDVPGPSVGSDVADLQDLPTDLVSILGVEHALRSADGAQFADQRITLFEQDPDPGRIAGTGKRLAVQGVDAILFQR